MIRSVSIAAVVSVALGGVAGGSAQELTPEQQSVRAILRELVENNTTHSVGSTTVAAQAVATRLKAAGFADADVTIVAPAGAPKRGNLVARLRGTGARRPLLLLAHLDVVEAKREDWARDPFAFTEENGYFYGRGASDDKSMAAIFVEQMIRLKHEGFRPDRDLILALTADEEGGDFNGVDFLIKSHRELIDADLAINEGGGGRMSAGGRYEYLSMQVSEKVYHDYRFESTNPGGHSARPVPDNAIYHLSAALSRLAAYRFPFSLNDGTRLYFERTAAVETGQRAADMKAITTQPQDAAAIDRLSTDPDINGLMRTTCVATMLDGGHAPNALPQRAGANVNCRILPGVSIEDVRRTLVAVIADDQVRVTAVGNEVSGPPSPVSPDIMTAVESITRAMWPGVPVIPVMSSSATDGTRLNGAGIRTYGLSGMFEVPGTTFAHGLNERRRVAALYEGQEFLYRLTKALATPAGAASTAR